MTTRAWLRMPSIVVPLVVVGLLGATLGFIVTRQLDPTASDDGTRVSVIALPSTPTPEPTPTPTPGPTDGAAGVTGGGRTGGGSSGGARDDGCPSGCQCQHPPNGIVIVCR